MGVIFFVMNAAFALVLLILVLVSSVYAFVSKNPDVRYQPMRDDRNSFAKSNSMMMHSTELDALGVTARGDMKSRDLDDDRDSFTSPTHIPLPPSTAGSGYASNQYEVPRSPINNTVPFFPASGGGGDGRTGSPYSSQQPQTGGLSMLTPGGGRTPSRGGATSPSPSSHSSYQSSQTRSYPPQQQGPGGTGWQVGAGYS